MVAETQKKKLTISPCSIDESGNVSVETDTAFEVMLNPSTYSHEFAIDYSSESGLGKMAADTKFNAVKPEKINFDVILDGTGVVENTPDDDVQTQVKSLTDIIYKYDGSNHEPNHVRILWGSLIFYGRLDTLALEYTMFKPSGVPLRAKLKLAFSGFMSKEEEAKRANRSSPDLTHIIEFKAGDTLPALCYQVYKDNSYYLEVAKINKLTHFRNIKPGTKLNFPPLR